MLRRMIILAGLTVPAIIVMVNADCLAEAMQLPSIFSDAMVLQRGESVPVWG